MSQEYQVKQVKISEGGSGGVEVGGQVDLRRRGGRIKELSTANLRLSLSPPFASLLQLWQSFEKSPGVAETEGACHKYHTLSLDKSKQAKT